ncbi:MAG: hypothetical protein RJQ09_11315 [Cyclobacteriaceae bacterium]
MARTSDLNPSTNRLPEAIEFHSKNSNLSFSSENSTSPMSGGSVSSEILSDASLSKMDLTATVANLTRDVKCSFTNGIANICESYVGNRLKAKFRTIAKHGRKEAGSHAVLFSKFGETLSGFEFNSKRPYHETFKCKYFIKQSTNRGHLIIHFPAFVPIQELKAPKEATHFKLYSQLITLSDYEFDEDQGYRPISKKAHGKKSDFYSPMLPILKIPVQPMTSQLSVNNGLGVSDSTGLLLIMGVHFYSFKNSKYEPLPKESSLDIVKVF